MFYKLAKSDTEKIDNVKSWVYTIARNTITDYYRKRKIATSELGDYSFDGDYNQEDSALELSNCIIPFINELPEEYRSLMILSELEEISQKEIAEKLDVNYVTVRSKIQRGRKKLKDIFSDCCTFIQGGKGSIMDFRSKNDCDGESSC